MVFLFRMRPQALRWLVWCVCTALAVVAAVKVGRFVFVDAPAAHHVDSASESGLFHATAIAIPRASSVALEVVSSRIRVLVTANGRTIVDDDEPSGSRGLHVVVLEGSRGRCTAYRIFDTYSPGADSEAIRFLQSVPDGRIIVFAVKDEASHSMGKGFRQFLGGWSSSSVGELAWRDMWAFVMVKNGPSTSALAEAHSKAATFSTWGNPASLQLQLTTFSFPAKECRYTLENAVISERRRIFCLSTDGYPEICRCEKPDPIEFSPDSLGNLPFVKNGKITVPVTVIASNRPYYLNTMLRNLVNTTGVDSGLVTVFVDGLYDEPVRVASLYGVRAVQHIPGGHSNARISQHYRSSIAATFSLRGSAEYAVVLEEDLKVSPDFFSFIAQTLPLLEQDRSLFCISAWNDLGYENTVGNERMLYRVETMPGLGWVVSKKLFKNEMEKVWPSANKRWDWDMWMRSPEIRKGRECIIPDVSRTSHFGARGLNINTLFQTVYFDRHAVYEGPLVDFQDIPLLTTERYDASLRSLLKDAHAANHSESPCSADFFPSMPNKTLAVYVRMDHATDFTTWLQVCTCLKIWDLDQRGVHKGLWRFHAHRNQPVIVVGVPYSPFALSLPKNVLPIDLVFPSKSTARLV